MAIFDKGDLAKLAILRGGNIHEQTSVPLLTLIDVSDSFRCLGGTFTLYSCE